MTGQVAEALTLVPGEAAGPVVRLAEPLSFWGGLDPVTGAVIDRWHPQAGACLSRAIVVMRAGRGSSSGSSVLAEALRRGTGPAGLILAARDAIVVTGAMVAAELYGLRCPVVCLADADAWAWIASAASLRITAEADRAILEATPSAG